MCCSSTAEGLETSSYVLFPLSNPTMAATSAPAAIVAPLPTGARCASASLPLALNPDSNTLSFSLPGGGTMGSFSIGLLAGCPSGLHRLSDDV